jgi:hypothetical protein
MRGISGVRAIQHLPKYPMDAPLSRLMNNPG